MHPLSGLRQIYKYKHKNKYKQKNTRASKNSLVSLARLNLLVFAFLNSPPAETSILIYFPVIGTITHQRRFLQETLNESCLQIQIQHKTRYRAIADAGQGHLDDHHWFHLERNSAFHSFEQLPSNSIFTLPVQRLFEL